MYAHMHGGSMPIQSDGFSCESKATPVVILTSADGQIEVPIPAQGEVDQDVECVSYSSVCTPSS